MEFNDVIRMRTSVRGYSSDEVPDEKIESILECARLAPSWANKQCWSFLVIKDNETIEQLSRSGGGVNKWMRQAPVIIVACGDPNVSGHRNDMAYYLVDVAIAMEHLVLAATDLGLGTCWIGAFDEGKVKDALKIPKNIKVVALTPLGYPTDKRGIRENLSRYILKSKKRKSLDDIVHHGKW